LYCHCILNLGLSKGFKSHNPKPPMMTSASKRAFALLTALLLQTAAAFGVVSITTQPEAVTAVADGAKITLQVVASSTNTNATFSYRWFKRNGSNYDPFSPSSPSNSLVFASAKPADAGVYRVLVTENGTSDTAESDDAEIIVNVRPRIVVHPLSLSSAVTEGGAASFSVTLDAAGTPPFSYTWQRKVGNAYVSVGAPVNKSELNDTLQLSNVQLANAGSYRVSVTNLSGIIVNSKDAVLRVNSRPVIVTQHATALTITHGASSTLRIVAGGNSPFTYTWFKDNVAIPKSNRSSLTIKGTDSTAPGVAEGPGEYKVKVTNQFTPDLGLPGEQPTESAQVATVQVIRKPKIVTQPQRATIDITAGPQSPNLMVVMDTTGNEGVLQYQWQKDGKNIADTLTRTGTNAATLSFTSFSWSDRGSYRVLVRNEVGTVTSASAVLTILSPPTIISEPVGPLFGATGGSIKMNIVAGGSTPLVYAWRFRPAGQALFNDRVLSKTASLSLTKLSAASIGEYQCTITNAPRGAAAVPAPVLSSLIYLQVDDAPKITQQTTVLPYDATPGLVATPKIPADKKLHLRVAASGTDRAADVPAPPAPDIPANPLTFQWLKNNLPLAGENDAELIIDPAQLTDTGKYSCIVQNFSGRVTSKVLTITVSGPPVITAEPANVTGIQESTIETSLTVTGSPTIKYRWQKEVPSVGGGTTWENVPGKTSAKLVLPAAKLGDAGIYKCIVSNDFGSTESDEAVVTVTPIPPPTIAPVSNQSIYEFYPAVARAGEKVRIFGQNLNYTTRVLFGGQPATFVKESPNSILATVPGSAPLTNTPIEVGTVNPTTVFTSELFRRTTDYENAFNFYPNPDPFLFGYYRYDATILTAAPGVFTRVIVNGSNEDTDEVYFLIRVPNPSNLTVFVTGLQSAGRIASLHIDLHRQAGTNATNTNFAGPDGVMRFPINPTISTPLFTIGANQVSLSTTNPNEFVLIRIEPGTIILGSNWVWNGPFQLRVSVTPSTTVSKKTAESAEIVQVGGLKTAFDLVEDTPGQISDSSSTAVRFGGDVNSSTTEPMALWHDVREEAKISRQVVSKFSMSLEPGEENGDDQFGWQVSGSDGKSLLALWVDSTSGRISSVEPDGTVHESIQHITPGGGAHRFEIVVNQDAGSWIIHMDGVPVTQESIPLPPGACFSDVSTVWDLGQDGRASGASIIFDDFSVEAEVTAQ
jgi:hypothetical protein